MESTIQWRAHMLVATQVVGLLAMVGVTWRLWFPWFAPDAKSAELLFPSVPVFGFLASWSPVLSWVISSGLICFSILGIYSLFKCRTGFARSIALWILLILFVNVLLNQHKFLPWVWQSMLLFIGFGLLQARNFLRYARVLLVSIYVWSAISKLDYQFAKTTGREILQTLTGMVGLDSTNWSEPWTDCIVIGFPVMELLVGVGLMFGATRLIAMFSAIGMHVILLLALGPLGLNNAESVLLWNLQFIVQLCLLYWPARRVSHEESTETEPAKPNQNKLFFAMAFLVCLYPLLEKFNCVDHWPAWGLYSPQASRSRLKVPEWKVQTLTSEVQGYFKPPDSSAARMQEFKMAKWSIDRLNAPLYPQDRFQFALATFLVDELSLDRTFLIEIQSASNWWTGERDVKRISSQIELHAGGKWFWGNTVVGRGGKSD